MTGELRGRRIALPESRELDLLSGMLERHGAEVLRCPLVGIVDAPDQAAVEGWVRRFAGDSCTDLVIYTGEGLRRLLVVAERIGVLPGFVAALAEIRKITRGPKPARALREIGLKPDLAAEPPTTAGLIAALGSENLTGRRVGIQLYPGDRPAQLVAALEAAGAALDPVAPYAYIPEAADGEVIGLIDALDSGRVDAIAFTSAPQVRRLRDVAAASGRADGLRRGLARTRIAAVGPIVAEEIEKLGVGVHIAPSGPYSLKPLVTAIVAALAAAPDPPPGRQP